MKDCMVGFLVLLALAGLSVAKKNPPGQEHRSEEQSTDCSAYKGLQLRQCLRDRQFSSGEQKCSPGNANCDCTGEGNTCERSPGEDRNAEQDGHGGDHGGHKEEHNGKGNKGHGSREDNGHGNGGQKTNKDNKDRKHDNDSSDSHEKGSKDGHHEDDDRQEGHGKHEGQHGSHEKGSKHGHHEDDDRQEGHGKHEGHHGSHEKGSKDGHHEDGGSHEGHGKHEGHHGSHEDGDEHDHDSNKGHGKHKEHHSSKGGSHEDDDGSHEGHGKRKGHHGSHEDSDEDDNGSHKGHGKHKEHHNSKEDSHEDDGSHEGHGKHKRHHGSHEDSDEDDNDSRKGHGQNKGHHSSKEDSHEDDGSHEGHGKHKGHHGSHEDSDEHDNGNHKGHGQHKGHHSSEEGSHEDSRESATVEELGDELMNVLNNTDGGFEQVLFIVDSSQNVGETTFSRTELNVVKVITQVLFSRISFFGLTTYNDVADVVIPIDEYQSSGFIQRVDNVRYTPRDGSDLANVLDRSFSDIQSSGRRTLVVLISGTESSTDGSGEARLIQDQRNIIIPVVVGEVNRNTAISISSVNEEGSSLYFVFQNWEIFSSTTTYIIQNYGSGSTDATQPTDETSDYRTTDETTQTSGGEYETTSSETTSPATTGANPTTSERISACDALENIQNGHWESSTCSEESNAEGTVCHLVCETGYDLSGDADMTCTHSGWESSDGDNQLPACMTLEERSSELMERLNYSLHNASNILIVLDESSSVGQDHFTNIQLAFFNTLLNLFSLTARSIGVVTYSDTSDVVISLGNYERSVLQERINAIPYEQGDVSNIENALNIVTSEIQRSGVTGSTLIILVSASNSSTDGSSQARQINNNGDVIFPLVVGSDYNRLLHISSVTESKQRTFFKFTSWESFSSILSFVNENYRTTDETTQTSGGEYETTSYETTSPDTTGANPTTSERISACDALENIQNGHWESSSCSEESSAEGTVCHLVCETGYDLSGDADMTCTHNGWESSDGDSQLPACMSYETTSPATTGANPTTSERISACDALENIQNGHWESSTCSEESSAEGTVCHLECETGYDLSGDADMTCTHSGWESSDGDSQLPACMTLEERSSELMERLNYTLHNASNILIVLDESSSVGQDHFTNIQLAFFNTLLNLISLTTRSVGVVTYSDTADVVISLGNYERSVLQERINAIPYEQGGVSNIENALNIVTSEIQRSGVTGSTLIILVSASNSSTDGSSQARQINNNGDVIFPLVVGSDYNRLLYISSVTESKQRTFFKFTSWESFSSILSFVNENYRKTDETTQTSGGEHETTSYETTSPATIDANPTTSERISACDALENIQNGHWESSTCSEESSAEGTVCHLECETGYDLSGDADMACTHSGWESSDGDNQLPACMTLEERSSELMERLNYSLHNASNILIVLDESSSVGEDHFTNIQLAFFNTLLNLISLSTRSIGVVTYSDTADVVISLGNYERSVLQERINTIPYEQGGVSNIENALNIVTSEIQRSGVSGSTLIILVSASNSSTDGSSQARQINNNGDVIFPLIVGSDYNRLLYISSATESEQRTFFKFTSWESFSSILSFVNENYRMTDETTQTSGGEYETTNYEVTEEPTTPASQSVEDVGEEVVSIINGTFTGFQQVLFIVDSSRNVGESTFYNTELTFVKTITGVVFSRISYFGLITYNDHAEVAIPFTEIESAEFIQRVDSVQYSPRDGSDIANVLDLAFSNIRQSGRRTLVVFISGTESSVDGSDEASVINNQGNFIIPVFVGDVNRETAISISSMDDEGSSVYFLFQNWEIFNATTIYIRQTYISDSTGEVHVCEALENSQRGHWEASNCSLGTSELGTVCKFVCEEGYELSGTPEVTCNQSGWVRYGEDTNMPSCKTIEEIGKDFIANINRTLGRPANLMFVVDGSGSLTEEEFGLETGLVNAIVRAFPLSEDRSAGVVTFSSDATVNVPVNSDDTCTFLNDVSAIRYPRGGTNLAQALQLANNELEQNAVHDFTVTFLITDGISTTDPTEPAAVLKRGGNPLFAIGVGDYDAEQLTSIATYFYPIRDFGIFNSLKNVLETEYANRTDVQC